MSQVIWNRLMYLHQITIFHIVRFLIGYTIQVNDAILDFQGLSRQTHATLDIVLATIYRSTDDFAECLLVLVDILTAHLVIMVEYHALLCCIHDAHIHRLGQFLTCLITQTINVFSRHIDCYGIPCREVEYHDVIELYITETFHTLVIPCRPFQIRLGIHNRQRMLGQRHVKRCLWNARTITGLAHKQIIAHQQ